MIDTTRLEGGPAERARRLEVVAARLCGLEPHQVCGGQHGGAQAALARQLAMYLANRVYHFSHARSAALFGRRRNAASYACRRIETLRQEPRFDWQVFEVETLLRAADLVSREMDHAV